MSSTSSPTRARVQPGAVMLVVTASLTVAALLIDLRVPGSHREELMIEPGWSGGIPALALSWAGAVVLRYDPSHRLGWVLGVFGVWWAADSLAGAWLTYATLEQPALAGASAAFWVFQRLGAGLLLALPLVLLLFPDGRFPPGRWRTVSVLALAAMSLLPLVLLAVPADVAQSASGEPLPEALTALDLDPLSLPLADGVWEILLRTAFLLVAVSVLPALAVVVHRYSSGTAEDRRRLRWLLWAGVVDALVMLTIQLLPQPLPSWGLTVAVVLTSAAVVAGVTRPDVVDIDRLLGGTVVYALLLGAVLVLDLGVLAATRSALGSRLDSDQALVLAVFVVAVVYAPLRHRMSQQVRRRLVGEREDPYAVVSALAERLEDSADSDVQLLAVAGAVAAAFRSPYVGVEIRQGNGSTLLAEHGHRPGEVRALPISYRGEQVGRLLLPATGVAARLRPADERLMGDMVRQAAAAARAAQLADELQRSRERLVTAVEDERRRLRRELHDGLGPSLAAVASRIDTARLTASRSPEESSRMLGLARQELTGLLAEVRRLVHGLRPPALDDVGLVRALRQQAESLSGPALSVRVEAPDLGDLPAAVEVAAFRIASESLTNVHRHARASQCAVRLLPEPGRLVVEVVDDGVGIGTDTRAGVGLVSLRERAEELGGRCDVTAVAGGGTRVRAVLPLPAPTLATTAVGPAVGEGADGD